MVTFMYSMDHTLTDCEIDDYNSVLPFHVDVYALAHMLQMEYLKACANRQASIHLPGFATDLFLKSTERESPS